MTILAIYGIAFLFSVLAPGNAFRQVTIESKPNIITAFFMAIGKSFEFLSDTLSITQFLMIALLAPTIAKMASNSRFKFSHPWLCIIITITLYSSFFFAHCYAMGTRGPGRVQNIYSYMHQPLLPFWSYPKKDRSKGSLEFCHYQRCKDITKEIRQILALYAILCYSYLDLICKYQTKNDQ